MKPEPHDDKQAKSKQVVTCYFEHADRAYRGASGKEENCVSGHKDLFWLLEYLQLFEECWIFTMYFTGFSPLCEIMPASGFLWCPCRFELCCST